MNELHPQSKALLKAYDKVIDGWRGAADESVMFTSSGYLTEFAELAGSMEDTSRMYAFLRAAYSNETELIAALDRVGKFFDRKVETLIKRDMDWSRFSELRSRISAVNRAMNDMTSDRKKQIIVVLVGHELLVATQERHV